MHKPQTRTLTSDLAPGQVLDALQRVADGSRIRILGFSSTMSVVSTDPQSRTVTFTNSRSGFSWQLELIGVVTPSATGVGSHLEVTAGGQDTAPKALMDAWKHGKAADQVIEQVRDSLASV